MSREFIRSSHSDLWIVRKYAKSVEKDKKPVWATNIVGMRKALGFKSAMAFAEAIGVEYPTLRDIEAGYSEGRLETRQAIARALGCDLADLYKSPSDASAASFLTRLGGLSPLRQKIVLTLVFDDAVHMRGASQGLIQAVESLLKGHS